MFQLSTEREIKKKKKSHHKQPTCYFQSMVLKSVLELKGGLGRGLLIFCLFLQNKSSSGERRVLIAGLGALLPW